jgi:putative transposase
LRLSEILRHLGVGVGLYYRATRGEKEKEEKKMAGPTRLTSCEVEKKIVEVALSHAILGYKKIHHILRTRHGVPVNRKAVYRVLKKHALLKKLKTRQREIRARYQAKLSALRPTSINELWQMDVTYVYIEGYGFWFQIDIQDYFSKYVLAQRLCPSYSAREAVATLKAAVSEAERLSGPLRESIHLVTDNGSTFIAKLFTRKIQTDLLLEDGEKIFDHIRIGYRRPEHIGSIERFHGSYKQECVYLHWFQDPIEAERVSVAYGAYYNFERPHWAHRLKTPAEVYLNKTYEKTLSKMPAIERIDPGTISGEGGKFQDATNRVGASLCTGDAAGSPRGPSIAASEQRHIQNVAGGLNYT